MPRTTTAPPCKRRRRHQVELVEGAEEAPMNFTELSTAQVRKKMKRRRLKPEDKAREELIKELQRECRC